MVTVECSFQYPCQADCKPTPTPLRLSCESPSSPHQPEGRPWHVTPSGRFLSTQPWASALPGVCGLGLHTPCCWALMLKERDPPSHHEVAPREKPSICVELRCLLFINNSVRWPLWASRTTKQTMQINVSFYVSAVKATHLATAQLFTISLHSSLGKQF